MSIARKIVTGALLIAIGGLITYAALKYFNFGHDITGSDIEVSGRTTTEEEADPVQPQMPAQQKVYVNVFFIGQNDNKEEVYKAVKRQYDETVDGSKIKYAIESLVAGPRPNEREKGVYSEIPSGTEVLSIKEYPDKVVINLSAAFETGGGTDSLYKRLYQLIKTAKRNTTLPVYLYIEGQKADVIGGEGIMLNQPLNDSSLDG
mgnify:FL=1